VSLEDKYNFVYFALIIFVIPLLMIVYIYIQIVKYMKNNPFSSTNRSTVTGRQRQQSELRLIRRILILVLILFVLGFPYSFFYLTIHLHLFTPWRRYMPRISYIFITFGQSASMLINLITTDNVRKSLINLFTKRHIREEHI
jgi:ABC-type Fe3+ transport system permease subunit